MLEATSRERNFFHEVLHGDTGCPLPQSILRAGILFTYSEGWSYAGSPVKVIHLLSFCYTTGLLHRHSEGGHHAGQNIRTFCGEKSSFRHGTWHVGTRPGSGPTRSLVCPDGAEAVHPYLVVFNRLCLAQPGRLSQQALGACSLSGPRRRGWGLAHRGLQQTQRGRDPHLGSTGALEGCGIDATSRAA